MMILLLKHPTTAVTIPITGQGLGLRSRSEGHDGWHRYASGSTSLLNRDTSLRGKKVLMTRSRVRSESISGEGPKIDPLRCLQ